MADLTDEQLLTLATCYAFQDVIMVEEGGQPMVVSPQTLVALAHALLAARTHITELEGDYMNLVHAYVPSHMWSDKEVAAYRAKDRLK